MSERLTKRLANGGVMYDNGEYWRVCYPWNEHCLNSIDRMAIKLCELEDKIEQVDVVEVRHGEWLMPLSDEPWRIGYFCRCSVCDKTNNGHTLIVPNFCENCGAKMDGERRGK